MAKKRGPRDRQGLLEGKVEIFAYQKGVQVGYQVYKNIILYQGLAEIIRGVSASTLLPLTTSTVNGVTIDNNVLQPRIIGRMAIGDQGASIVSNATVLQVPTQLNTGLYHEVYRQNLDSDSSVLSLINPATGFTYTGNSTAVVNPANPADPGFTLTDMSSTFGITVGTTVTDTTTPANLPTGTVVAGVPSSTSITLSNPANDTTTGDSFLFKGAINECEFISTFYAADVATTAFSDPSNPVVNEVGLVILNPSSSPAYATRAGISAPNANATDEVLFSIRTFSSVPFNAANEMSITVRYTVYTE
jgi:hypothetical protein